MKTTFKTYDYMEILASIYWKHYWHHLLFPDLQYPFAQPDQRLGHKSFHIFLYIFEQVGYGKVLGAFFQTFSAFHTHGGHCLLFRNQTAVLKEIHHF